MNTDKALENARDNSDELRRVANYISMKLGLVRLMVEVGDDSADVVRILREVEELLAERLITP
jgi:hypothetical protein